MKTLLAVAVIATSLCACVATPASVLNRLSVGMTKSQVTGILGEPLTTSAEGRMVILHYWLLPFSGSFQALPYSVTLNDGYVTAYGRDGEFSRAVPLSKVGVAVPTP